MNKTIIVSAFVLASMLLLTSCRGGKKAEQVQEEQPQEAVANVIIDMDLGSSTDDVICLALAYKYQNEGRLKVLGTVVDRMGEQNADVAQAINAYYGCGDIPVGLERHGAENPMLFIDYAPLFKRSAADSIEVPEGYRLYRKLLAEAPDHSVDIISCGFVTVLSQLLASGADEYSDLEGVELVRRKVRGLHLQAGMFQQAQEPDFNFKQVPPFARKFIELWPDDIPTFYNPMEVGQDVDYKPEMVLDDLKDDPSNPIYRIYSNCNCDTGQRMWDALNVIWLMEGDSLFNASALGRVRWNDNFSTSFSADSAGSCRYLMPFTPQQAEDVLQLIRKKLVE